MESDTSKYLIDDWALSMETVKPKSNPDIQNSITKKDLSIIYVYIVYNLINHDLYNTSVKNNEKSYRFWAVHFLGPTLCADISRLPSSCTARTTFEQCRLDGTGISCNSRCWFRRIVVLNCIFIICIFDCEHLLSEDELLDWLRHLSQSFGQFRGDWSQKLD